jgi:hypothetical protein
MHPALEIMLIVGDNWMFPIMNRAPIVNIRALR